MIVYFLLRSCGAFLYVYKNDVYKLDWHDAMGKASTFEEKQLTSANGWQFVIIDKFTFFILETDV